jgi:uncharacterized repeat protein (TIGR01451 family)
VRRAALAGVTSAALLAAGAVPVALAPAALADPAAPAPTSVFGVGAVAGVVPDGVCAVEAVVVGGAGGRAAAGANGLGSNGGAARVAATFDVLPGTAFGGTVGGGGRENSGSAGGAGGANGGGAGGAVVGQHGGAGGGGYSELTLGGDLAVLAGGGGGSGGGHSVSADGFGGDAGLPVTAGTVAAGSAGTDGFEGRTAAAVPIVVGGGQGGGETTPGAGGAHSTDPTLDGLPGAGRTGGAGAFDPNYDAGGGGGGGYQGGGGGASTLIQNTDPDGTGAVISTVAGGGGGGGSSLVAAAATAVDATAVGRQTGTGAGAAGSITLDWVECAYDLAVTKTVAVDGGPAGATAQAVAGDVLTWTVTITNRGPEAMTRGDLVTLRDVVPGTGPAVLTSVTTTGGTNDALERGPVTCDAVAGDVLPAELECARPFAALGEGASGSRGLDAGETLTVVATQTVADPEGTTLTNVASVEDRGDATNNTATATATVIAPPAATDDADRGNTIGDAVVVDVLGNDSGTSAALDPASVVLRDPSGAWVTSLTVPGEGRWVVDPATGAVTFTPAAGFGGDPTPVAYRVADVNGLTASARVVVTYLPQATDDADTGNTPGTAVTVDVLGNDQGTLDPTTVRLVDPADGSLVTRLVVDGEGTWSVDPATGAITFTPQAGFTGDPTPVGYRVSDAEGNVTSAQVVITYGPVVAPVVPVAGPAAGAPLAVTGAQAGAAAGAAVLLLLAGTALVAWRRRAGRA